MTNVQYDHPDQDAFELGALAYIDGETQKANPWHQGYQEYWDWRRGWWSLYETYGKL